ncbi:MAG TPA: helix-turn-helix domain-containing protein [Polyangia bacterium]|nr:helix-turn-helix domain-containing protein [Polyangia bacterium]
MTERIVDLEGLHDALDVKRRAEGISWRQAATQMGVSASTLTRMAQGKSPDVEGFGRMVRWLGAQADDFIAPIASRKRKPDQDLRVVVSRHLRASKELDRESAKALENIIETAYLHMKEHRQK